MLPTFGLLDLHDAGGEGQFRLDVRPGLATPFGFLYGGTGIAASIEAAERTTDRPLQWITTQFIGSPAPGSVVDFQVSLPANGRATTQSQVVATVDGEPVFTSLCAHTVRPGGDGQQFVEMPDVPAPDDCREMPPPFDLDLSGSFFESMDRRLAAGVFGIEAVGEPQHGGMSMWCRLRDEQVGSPATQAFVADIIPMGIGAALGSLPGATSLDNTLRVIDTAPSEWVLLELIPEGFQALDRSRIVADLERGRATDVDRPADMHHPHQPPHPLTATSPLRCAREAQAVRRCRRSASTERNNPTAGMTADNQSAAR